MSCLLIYIIGIKWSSNHLALSTAGTGCYSYYAPFLNYKYKCKFASVRCIQCLLGSLLRFKLSSLAPAV